MHERQYDYLKEGVIDEYIDHCRHDSALCGPVIKAINEVSDFKIPNNDVRYDATHGQMYASNMDSNSKNGVSDPIKEYSSQEIDSLFVEGGNSKAFFVKDIFEQLCPARGKKNYMQKYGIHTLMYWKTLFEQVLADERKWEPSWGRLRSYKFAMLCANEDSVKNQRCTKCYCS